MRFQTTYSYCPEESINNSGKRLLHWQALQKDFEKCHFRKRLLSDVYFSPAVPAKCFFEKIEAAAAAAVAQYVLQP